MGSRQNPRSDVEPNKSLQLTPKACFVKAMVARGAAELNCCVRNPHAPERMKPIPVKPHPYRQAFDSIEHTVRYAMGHPLQSKAAADAEKLGDTTLVDGCWSFKDFILGFSNSQWLHIFVSGTEVRWQLFDSQPVLSAEPQFRIGAPPIQLDWQGWIGVRPMNSSELVAKRIGAEFTKLLINHTGFFVYFRGHLVFEFHAAYRTDTGEDMLYVIEDD